MERVGGEKATSPRYIRTKRINALGVAFFNFCKLCQPASRNNRNYALLNTRKKKKKASASYWTDSRSWAGRHSDFWTFGLLHDCLDLSSCLEKPDTGVTPGP